MTLMTAALIIVAAVGKGLLAGTAALWRMTRCPPAPNLRFTAMVALALALWPW